MAAQTDLTTGNIPSHLRAQSVPMAWGVLASMGMTLTDTWFVGLLGTAELAAMGFTIPVVLTLFAFGWGFGTGVSALVGRALGMGGSQARDGLARDYTTQSILLALIIALMFSSLGYAFSSTLFLALGAPPSLIPLIRDYMDIWLLGAFAVVVPQVGNAAIRAAGNARLPGRVMIGAAALNVILDPILMFGWFGLPRLELQGAALASILSLLISFSVSLYMLAFKLKFLSLLALRNNLIKNWGRLTGLALPAIGNNLVFPASAAVTTWLVAQYGSDAIAGLNVALRLEQVTMVPITALTFALASLSGQNLGAGKIARVRQALRASYSFAWWAGGGVALFSLGAAYAIVPLFTADVEAIYTARLYLILVPLTYPLLYLIMLVSAAGNGMGHTTPALIFSLGRMIFLFVPLALILDWAFGQAGLFAAMAVSNALVCLGAVRYMNGYLMTLGTDR